MAEKKATKKRGKYDKPLEVKAEFFDVLKASVKHAEANSPKNKKPKKWQQH